MITRRSARLAGSATVDSKSPIPTNEKKPKSPRKRKPTTAPEEIGPTKSSREKRVPKTSQSNETSELSKEKGLPKPAKVKEPPDTKLVKKLKKSENLLNFSSNHLDPVVEYLKESLKNARTLQGVNLDSEIIDQISLEGLSGITFGRMLRMIDAILPNLNCLNDHNCYNYVWSVLLERYLNYPPESSYVQAFYLDPAQTQRKESSDDTPPTSTRKVFIDRQLKLPHPTMKRFAKMDSLLHPVQDGQIMGSCANYLDRTDVTRELIEQFGTEGLIESLHGIDLSYGLDNIYFVASQTLRSKAILPNWADPHIDIKLREYCTLELIGKSRTLGTVFPNDKSLGRYRIMLMAKGFISQYQETNSSPIEHHLIRFSKVSNHGEPVSKSKLQDECDDEPEVNLSRLCCNPGKLKIDRSMLTMVYDSIARSRKGVTQLDLRRKLNIPRHHLRNHLKNLISIEMIHSHKRQKPPDKAIRVYSSVKPSIYRRKKKLETPTGIMANWDEPDLKAKEILGHRRSSFTQAEDSLLILCRITSILIEPKLRLSWCVHKRVVRDVLHNELVESHDKTSDACLRRIKYLKQLPNNIMSINELTAELFDDSDITKLINNETMHSETRLNKLFIQVLRVVRSKIPQLLGLTSSSLTPKFFGKSKSRVVVQRGINNDTSRQKRRGSPIEIKDFQELKEHYELADCDSVASITRAPTYDQAKNSVDVRFNNAALVTMAYALCNCLDKSIPTKQKLDNQWLLEKFYSNYPDKLVSSMLSKLNKRSLLTRKCANETTSSIARPKVLTKLNQSVLFMLNRYHSSSLVQLVQPISQSYKIDLSENNEMVSFALLTSLCTSSSFGLDLVLKIPANVVGIDQGNENFRSVCDKANPGTREVLARFMGRCGGPSSRQFNESEPDDAASSDTAGAPIAAPSGSGTTKRRKLNDATAATAGLGYDEADRAASSMTAAAPSALAGVTSNNKMDDSRRALFLLRHELRSQALDKCGNLSDCLIVQPCKVKFHSEKELKWQRGPLDEFLAKARPVVREETAIDSEQQQQQPANWLVKSFRLPADKDLVTESQFETNKLSVEFSARLWKRIDGSINMVTLFKLIESLLSWIIVFPGIERDLLEREFGHLMPTEHLFETLELMEELSLIEAHRLAARPRKPRLFGYSDRGDTKPAGAERKAFEHGSIETYEATADSYVRLCQLLEHLRG